MLYVMMVSLKIKDLFNTTLMFTTCSKHVDQQRIGHYAEFEHYSFSCKLRNKKTIDGKLGYPISLLTPKTAPPCPSKDLRGPALGHPEVYRVNPDLPRPPKRPRGGTLGLVLMKARPTRPAFLGTFGALPGAP